MFILEKAPEHILVPSDYTSSEIFKREMSVLFGQSWLLAARQDELAEPGRYVALDLFGIPVVLRNENGVIVAFKNICAHRNSQLVKNGCGEADKLRCQYHGWEYNAQGRIAKIPDAPNFSPMDIRRGRLSPLACEVWCNFVFINFADQPPAFAGEFRGSIEDLPRYYQDRTVIAKTVMEIPANWKLVVENAVESYHVPMVHPTTFAQYRPEEFHIHAKDEGYNSYQDTLPLGNSLFDRIYQLLPKILFPRHTFDRFKHAAVYPQHLFYYGDFFSQYVHLEPLAADRTRYTLYLLFTRESRSWFFSVTVIPLLKLYFARIFRKITKEDVGTLSDVQNGNTHSGSRGILSRREERVYFFQKYWQEKMKTLSAREEVTHP